MTHPKEAEHLSGAMTDKEIDENLEYINDFVAKDDPRIIALANQAKAYNTVKGERDALNALIEGLEVPFHLPLSYSVTVTEFMDKLKAKAQTIKEKHNGTLDD